MTTDLDVIARAYDPSSPVRDFDWWLLHYDFEELTKFLVGRKVLELGCGRGVITKLLAQVSDELIVVEGSSRNIAYTRRCLGRSARVSFHRSLWENFRYDGSDLSDIVFFSGLEHIDGLTARRILRRIRGWLRKHGRLHVIVPNANSLHRRVAVHMGLIDDVHELNERDRRLGHTRVFDKDTLIRELKVCGFRPLHCTGVFLKPLPNDMMLDLNSRIIRGFYRIGIEFPDYCAHIFVTCRADTLHKATT
jgi:SAM-dependent methyltransferase